MPTTEPGDGSMVVCTDTITKDLTEVLLYQGTDRTSFTPTADPGHGMVVCIDKHPLFASLQKLNISF